MPASSSAPSASRSPAEGAAPPRRPFAVFLQLVRADRGALCPMFAGAAATALLSTAQMALLAWLLVVLFQEGRPLSEAYRPLAGFALLLALRALLAGHAARHGARVAARARAHLRERLLRRWTDPRTNPLAAAPPSTRASQLMEGVERCGPWFSHFLPAAVDMAVIPALLAIVVLLVDWRSGLILALTGPLIPVLMAGIGIFTKRRSADQLAALHRMSAHFHEVLRAFETLVLFGQEESARARVGRVARSFRERTMRVLRLAFLSGFVLELAASLSIALVAISVGLRLLDGELALLPALFILLLAPEFYLAFRRVGSRHHMAMEASAALEPLLDELEVRPGRVAADAPPAPLPSCGVALHALRLRHPDAGEDALEPIDLRLPPRGLFAVAGPSGAGKSTFFAGLMGFVPSHGGRTEPPLQRAHFAWVPQHPFFADVSMLETLRLADPTLETPAAAQLLRQAAAEDLLPRLYDGESLGEDARRLSGGQRQRLALARALASRAPILLLDEPTASLDDEGERAVLSTLAALACERLVLAITHRIPVAAAAEGILLVQGGRLRGPLALSELHALATGGEGARPAGEGP